MSRFVDYFIVESDSIVNLQDSVNQLALEGYRPQGGLAVWVDPISHDADRDGHPNESLLMLKFGQAMVRMESD